MFSRRSRQRAMSADRLRAVEACDQLLAQWQMDGRPVPPHATGTIGADGRFRWSTGVVRTEWVEKEPVRVIRLDIAGETDEPLASVELLAGPRRVSP